MVQNTWLKPDYLYMYIEQEFARDYTILAAKKSRFSHDTAHLILLNFEGVSASKPEEQRLREENERLREEIEKLKVKLVMTEVKNGGKVWFFNLDGLSIVY